MGGNSIYLRKGYNLTPKPSSDPVVTGFRLVSSLSSMVLAAVPAVVYVRYHSTAT